MASREAKSHTISRSKHERTKNFYIPEEIIEIILAYLPIRDVARLSILSKRFANSWKICRNLSFTKEIARKFSKEEFVKFINNFFLNISENSIYRFSLYFDPTDDMDLVQYWVHKAIQCGITELDLDFSTAEHVHMLSYFLTSIDNLRILKLNKCELDLIPKPYGLCPLLQLTLQNVRVLTLQVIFSNCLKLTSLELINCDFLYHLKILAQDLKGFNVLVVKNCPDVMLLRINAPSLQSIHYEGKICEIKFESDLPYLSDVVLNITSPRAFQLLPHRNDVMIALANVTTLAVNHTFLEAFCVRFEDNAYRDMGFFLWKLKEFHLLVGGESHVNPLDIAIFLKRCPHVERVFIDLGKYAFAENVYWENHGRKIILEFDALFPFIEFVKIKGFALKETHVSMARLFLRNAPYLQSLVIVKARNGMSPLRVTPGYIAAGIWTNAKIEIYEHLRDKSAIFPKYYLKAM